MIFKKKRKEENKKTWKDITLGQFLELSTINPDDENASYEYLAIVEGMDVDTILEMNWQEVIALMNRDLEFLKEAPKTGIKPKREYELNGTTYVALLDPTKMTTAQYIDFQALNDYSQQTKEMLSIFLVPEGMKYNDGYDMEKAQKDIYDYLPVEEALTLAGFFLTLYSVSTRLTLGRLRRTLRKLEKEAPTEEIKEQIRQARKGLRKFASSTTIM